MREASIKLEYLAILNLLDETYKDSEHLDVLLQFTEQMAKSSIQELKQVPKQIELEIAEIEQEKSQILNSNYKLFLESNTFLIKLLEKLDAIIPETEKLHQWPDKIIKKLDGCNDTREKTIGARKEIHLLSKQLEHLEPILEIPALFETLLRNGHHEEAMDLQLFTQRLPIRYPNIPYLAHLASIETNSQVMLVQLLSMLRGPVKLPVSMRVIGYLKRLNYNETTLRILFLSLRNEYLSGLLTILKEAQPQDYVRRWIETQREHLFDTITHYKHIFPDTPKTSLIDCQILPSFSTMAISSLLKVLSTFLSQAHDVSVLPSVCTQVMYYGMTLGRIGLDFRQLASPLFESAVLRIVLSLFHHAAGHFTISSTSVIERPNLTISGQDLLMKSMPVAVLYNQYMNALNQLRYLPCVSLYSQLLEGLKSSMKKVTGTILAAQSTYRRESEIVAWIISDALLQPVFEGLDKVLCITPDSYSHYAEFLDELRPLFASGKARIPSIVNNLGSENLPPVTSEGKLETSTSVEELQEMENILLQEDEAVGK